jgi:pSer/pThr/pTyr-binding forkhead associated (FHA) protein
VELCIVKLPKPKTIMEQVERYVIKHLTGSKANQVEEFDFHKPELSFGRASNNDVQFDPETDLVVSREHAKIVKDPNDSLSFMLVDNESRNGLFVNKQKIKGATKLSVGDTIQLGSKGPTFVFDLNPRPQSMALQTQIIDISPATAEVNLSEIRPKTEDRPTVKPKATKFYRWLVLPALMLVGGAWALTKPAENVSIAKFSGDGEIKVEIMPMQAMMPAAYKIYSNPMALEGRFYFAKLIIDNIGKGEIRDMKVEYMIPGYVTWTTATEVKHVLPNGSAVVTIYPQFPQSIVEKTTESAERAQIRITYNTAGRTEKYEKAYQFTMLSRNDFLYTSIPASEITKYTDSFDNDDLTGCFVTPQDPIVKYYTQQVQEKVLGGEAASVGNDPQEAIRFMMGVYEATRRTHMVYSGTEGFLQKTGDIQSTQQHLRLPREVITGNTALCIEFACMYASIFQCEGLEPVIFMVPGHAYPGIKFQGQLFAIESTAVNGEGLGGIKSADEAFARGMQEMKECLQKMQQGDPRYKILDVKALQQKGVQPMELKDNAFMRNKVDELASQFAIGGPLIFEKATNVQDGKVQ